MPILGLDCTQSSKHWIPLMKGRLDMPSCARHAWLAGVAQRLDMPSCARHAWLAGVAQRLDRPSWQGWPGGWTGRAGRGGLAAVRIAGMTGNLLSHWMQGQDTSSPLGLLRGDYSSAWCRG